MCGAPAQSADLPAGVDADTETVLTGRVLRQGEPVAGAYVRLLDSGEEFTAEVVTSASGHFRFFAAPGLWTLRVLHRSGNGTSTVRPRGAGVHAADIELG